MHLDFAREFQVRLLLDRGISQLLTFSFFCFFVWEKRKKKKFQSMNMIMLLYFSFLVDILFMYCLQLCLYVEYFSYFCWIQTINQILRKCFYAEGTCSEHLVSLLSLVTLESELSLCHLWLGGTVGFPLFDLYCLSVFFLSFFLFLSPEYFTM